MSIDRSWFDKEPMFANCHGCYDFINLRCLMVREPDGRKFIPYCPCSECMVKTMCQRSCKEYLNIKEREEIDRRNNECNLVVKI